MRVLPGWFVCMSLCVSLCFKTRTSKANIGEDERGEQEQLFELQRTFCANLLRETWRRSTFSGSDGCRLHIFQDETPTACNFQDGETSRCRPDFSTRKDDSQRTKLGGIQENGSELTCTAQKHLELENFDMPTS